MEVLVILAEILEKTLKRSQGAEVFHVATRSVPAVFEGNRLKLLETRETFHVPHQS